MEAGTLPAPSAASLSERLRREQSLRNQVTGGEKPRRDVRPRKSPPKLGRGGDADRLAAPSGAPRLKTALSPVISSSMLPQTLWPVAERKSQEENVPHRRAKKGSQDENFDITPEGGSAGREGRQFTVANVGNHGRIYLRPTVRPAHQRYPQPNFVFPTTPPSTAGLDALTGEYGYGESPQLHGSHWTPSQLPSTPVDARQRHHRNSPSRPGHRRAASDSTIPDTSVARESEPGGFKIVITQPGEDQRPKTLEDLDHGIPPLLQVAIPTWKLGTPRFSMRGTPFIRGSSYAPTEDIRSSNASLLRTPRTNWTPDMSKKPSSVTLPPINLSQLDSKFPTSPMLPRLPPPLRSTYMSTHLVIEPAMFDSLTFKPSCDDRSIVRYSPSTGAVTAATPPRLVAEITSPTFLDYELISDFFLTFRAFLEPADLLRMLIARLRWAMARDDEVGMVVRVRTFVALRHWILNYFIDDFVVDYDLRVTFCNLLNDFVDELSEDLRGGKVRLKILAELKKCWRRVCAQYWDGPEFDANLGPDIPIAPGGIAGHRNPSLDPSFWERLIDGPPQLDAMLAPRVTHDETSFYADVSRAGHIDSVIVGDVRPGTPENHAVDEPERNQASPVSVASMEVISCSFPGKTRMATRPGHSYPPAAHPVEPSSVYFDSDPIATTPRALTGKRVRPQHSHRRNGSLTDSLREHTVTATEKVLYKSAEFLLTLPYAGSLVRGNLLPPGQAFVEILPPSAAGGPSRDTTVFQPHPIVVPKEKLQPSAMSSQGMRKLLSTVQRALSTKGQGVSPTQGNFINISPIGPRGVTTNRLPGTAIVPQARPRLNGARPPVRIDLLGAEIAEDFKRAVREDAAAEEERHQGYAEPSAVPDMAGQPLEYSAAHMDMLGIPDAFGRPTSDTGITTGSKSIVIVDDTITPDIPAMTGALPLHNPSVEAFAESILPPMADLTPPNTPPGQVSDTPRRSSYILSQHIMHPSLSADPLPPFVPDLDHLEPASGDAPPPEDVSRPSVDHQQQQPSRPPLSGIRGHRRHRSSKSLHSSRSMRHRRYASFTSGIVPQPTIRSFDATTYSEGSVDLDSMDDAAVPQPLRVLRRRPGGDLRAVTNVGDLDHAPLRRSRSVGSLTTFTESVGSSFIRSPVHDSSGFVDVVNSDYSNDRGDTFSLGAIAEANPKRQLSLFSTHSSKPIMRPSFEAEAKKLAQIPDDVDDDGGVESALLKLEGKFEKRPARLSMAAQSLPEDLDMATAATPEGMTEDEAAAEEDKKEHRHVHVGDEAPITVGILPSDMDSQVSFLDVPSPPEQRNMEIQSFLSDGTRASYSSIPLLERGLMDDVRSKHTLTREWTDRSVLKEPDDEVPTPPEHTDGSGGSQHPSYDFIKKTESMDNIKPGDTAPDMRPATQQSSFLDVDSDNESDLSSEMSAEMIDSKYVEEEDFSLTRKQSILAKLPLHPLAENPPNLPPPSPEPPSPPITLVQALRMSPETSIVPQLHEHQIWDEKPLPPTPDTTPTTAQAQISRGPRFLTNDPNSTDGVVHNAPKLPITAQQAPAEQNEPPRNKFSVHLPFILAFDSDILAQQFTLIEKDALNEVDWKELIEMRWKNAEIAGGLNARSWVSFLRNTDARGVEVVIARFNIMVKWAASEIVLTQDIEERARCIIKYIHIAAHCRRYRNFATMAQIAIALTSNEVSRLGKTWAMVPPSDQRTLKELEALVSPTRNFYNLRAEMEGGGTETSESGCIPFVGIYTHDLLFNSQRPSEIASSPTTVPLVNFERCRIAAGVVKTLLRLLEASTMYSFQPIEGITERCLWMGALTDEEIRRYGEALE